jgi:hypothetical protein
MLRRAERPEPDIYSLFAEIVSPQAGGVSFDEKCGLSTITRDNWRAMHSLVRFADIAVGGTFTTADLYAPALDALGQTETAILIGVVPL